LAVAFGGPICGSAACAQNLEPGLKPEVYNRELVHERAALAASETQLATTQAQLDDSKARLKALKHEREEVLRSQEGGLSSAAYDEIMRLLQTQKVQLTIDIAGIRARHELLNDELQKSQGQSLEQQQTEVNALQQILDLQTDKLHRAELMQKAGQMSEDEFLNAKQQLLEAQIRLQQARRPNKGPTGSLDNELLQVSLAHAESTARLQMIEQLLGKYIEARVNVDSLDELQLEWREQADVVKQLQARIRQLDAHVQDRNATVQRLEQALQAAEKSAGDSDRH
jgi:DNA repair exonuclease SbcCD ATPase subunit